MVDKLARNRKWHQKIAYYVVTYTELFFYNLGFKVAKKPKTTIIICWIVVALCSLGFLRFRHEKNPMKLWVPPDSSFVKDSEWLLRTFERGYRVEAALVKAPDVLVPQVLQELALIDADVKKIRTRAGLRYADICFKVPEISPTKDVFFKLSFGCDMLRFLDYGCYEKNILELWDYDTEILANITKQDILDKVNKYKMHPVYRSKKNYEDLLSGIVRNETGHIISATHLHTMWLVNVNFSSVDMDKSGNMAGTADWASEETLDWELVFTEYMKQLENHVDNFELFYSSARSFGDISNETMFQDLDILTIGCALMVIYIQLVISKYNWVEARIILGFLGLLNVAMAFAVGCGICSLLGIAYGPVHTSLPFLLMGLGVDDMFIILACWEDLTNEQKRLPLPERVGTMVKHAGVSITVTTFTDILAFCVGASTILPSLQSYCFYAASGVLMTFVFVVTFFVACFTLDEERIANDRNGFIPWIKHPNHKRNECSQQFYSKRIFHAVYSKIILSWPGKSFVLLVTLISLGFSTESLLKLEQKFDPLWFIPNQTHLARYVQQRKMFYPELGAEAGFYMGSIDYPQEIKNVIDVTTKLEANDDILSNVNSWVEPFRKFVQIKANFDIYENEIAQGDFDLYLSEFLFTNGSMFQANFQFEKELKCGEPAPKIQVSSIDFRFKRFVNPKTNLPVMEKIRDLQKAANFTTGDKISFVWSFVFAAWITDEIIDVEVLRNLLLALICVMVCTTVLIAHLQTCFWIFICVLLTMVNVCGFMQRWGLTIDVTSCIALELAIGLCVDYATHIGHTFLTIPEGTRNDRTLKTVTSIGSAVLYGGFSTLLGVCMLSFSDAYAFKTFFKIFFLVVLFGLYHGVVVLPVILSWIGPKPYATHQLIPQSESATQ